MTCKFKPTLNDPGCHLRCEDYCHLKCHNKPQVTWFKSGLLTFKRVKLAECLLILCHCLMCAVANYTLKYSFLLWKHMIYFIYLANSRDGFLSVGCEHCSCPYGNGPVSGSFLLCEVDFWYPGRCILGIQHIGNCGNPTVLHPSNQLLLLWAHAELCFHCQVEFKEPTGRPGSLFSNFEQ